MIRDRTKYGAVRTDGFASKREAHRYRELRLLERSGVITGLECQVAFELQAPASTGTLATVGRYIADFVYIENGRKVVEDAKGVRTHLLPVEAPAFRNPVRHAHHGGVMHWIPTPTGALRDLMDTGFEKGRAGNVQEHY